MIEYKLNFNYKDIFLAPRLALSPKKIWVFTIGNLSGYICYWLLTYFSIALSGIEINEAIADYGLYPCLYGNSAPLISWVTFYSGIFIWVFFVLLSSTAVSNITFRQLHFIASIFPNRFKDLYVSGTLLDVNNISYTLNINIQGCMEYNAINYNPNAVIDDGLLDLIIVKGSLSRCLLFKTLPKLFKGTHINDPNIEYKQVSKFSLLTKNKDLLNIDGELKGTTSIEVEVLNNAVEVFN